MSTKKPPTNSPPLKLKSKEACCDKNHPLIHSYGKKLICTTDKIGHASPGNRSPLEIVLDASEGFIPLWEEGSILRWAFDESTLALYSNPEGIKKHVRRLLGEALTLWGDSAPVHFSENSDVWDFKIRVEVDDNCNPSGCTLARAFFPDSGRHDLLLFPKMFEQSLKEQVDTVIHEIGHVFGLRHFFANVSETSWPSEVFGEHRPFSIMNYGAKSELTKADKNDLARLYKSAWSGEITKINGTPIRFVVPYHES